MADQGIRYTYDGTFEGYLCAVLAALRFGRVPASIILLKRFTKNIQNLRV